MWAGSSVHLLDVTAVLMRKLELFLFKSGTPEIISASRQIIGAARNNKPFKRLVARRTKKFRRHVGGSASGRVGYQRAVTRARQKEVRDVSKQRWVIRRHVFVGKRTISRLVVRVSAWCFGVLVAMSSPVCAQVVTPINPPSAPPWNSLEIFDPVAFADLWSRDPGEPVAPEDTPGESANSQVMKASVFGRARGCSTRRSAPAPSTIATCLLRAAVSKEIWR